MKIWGCNQCGTKVKSEDTPGSCIHILFVDGKDEDGCFKYRKNLPYEYNCDNGHQDLPYHNWKLIKNCKGET